MTDLSNWGRWGKDDQLGALNFITPAKKREAMALAKDGIVVSLEQPLKVVPKPEETKADGKPHGVAFYEIRFKTFPADDPRGNPGFTSDVQEYHVHGGMTHLDALCHDSSDGRLYNGYRAQRHGQRDDRLHETRSRQPQGGHRHARRARGHEQAEAVGSEGARQSRLRR